MKRGGEERISGSPSSRVFAPVTQLVPSSPPRALFTPAPGVFPQPPPAAPTRAAGQDCGDLPGAPQLAGLAGSGLAASGGGSRDQRQPGEGEGLPGRGRGGGLLFSGEVAIHPSSYTEWAETTEFRRPVN